MQYLCELCPRLCRAQRVPGKLGYCKAGTLVRVYCYGPHFGEEPPVSGKHGSGTVFFSHCTMRCCYCQNYIWSREGAGQDYSVAELESVFSGLSALGCHNLNLVSPTPWLPQIRQALESMRSRGGACLPIVFNTSSYERVTTLRALTGQIAIYLADLRYAKNETAKIASDAPDYVERSRAALKEMWRQVGPLQIDKDGVARSGLICRILVLPGKANEACANLEWLAANLGVEAAVSVMGQYTPAYQALARPGWDRKITAAEYQSVCQCMKDLRFEVGWQQAYEEETSTELLGFNMLPSGKNNQNHQS